MAKRVYLSGPMSGLPEMNFPAFNAAAYQLRAMGLDVVNPAEINPDGAMTWEQCMRSDIKALCDCNALVMLPGWEQSPDMDGTNRPRSPPLRGEGT